jgi:hypothetical protein
MPKNKIKKKDALDRFYTQPKVALECYHKVLPFIEETDLLIEPSAGEGSFFLQMREPKIGYDLMPKSEQIIQGDWFDQNVPKNCVIIGNPPFGEKNVLSKRFILHASESAKIIAFILPMVFRKETYQKVFSDEWSLIKDYTLPKNSFLFESNSYHVPTCFQIWEKNSNHKNLRESIKTKAVTLDFTFTDNQPTHFVFGASPSKIVSPDKVESTNRGYYVKSNIPNLEEKLKSVDWRKFGLSSVNGGVSWFTKQEIINGYLNIKSETELLIS